MVNEIVNAEKEFEDSEAERQKQRRLLFDSVTSSDPWWKAQMNLVYKHLQPQKQDVILDFGSASCEISEFLANDGCKVIAIDISQNMLLISKERLKKNNRILNLNYITGDCMELPLSSETFDKVVCKNTLHHLPCPMTAVQEMFRGLKSSGLLLMIEPNALNIHGRVKQLRWKHPNLESSFYPWELRCLLKKAGFRNIQVKIREYEPARCFGPPWLRVAGKNRLDFEYDIKFFKENKKSFVWRLYESALHIFPMIRYLFSEIIVIARK